MKQMIFIFIILSSAILFAETIIPAGEVSGNWAFENSPYLIEGEITVPDGETLNIEPGVLVEFQGHYKFHIQGRLLAIGTSNDIITFTINDTTNFHDQNLQEGAWQGIRFNNTPATNDSSKIVHCKIEYGKANGFDPPCSSSGGGIYAENFSKLIIRNTEISNNSAMLGGGIALDENSGITIENTVLSNNEGWLDGGGIYCVQSSPVLESVVLEANDSSSGGGMACWYSSSPTISNTQFISNSGTVHGGGLYCKYSSSPVLRDVVFTQNSSSYGAAINFNDSSNPRIYKALIYDNHSTNSSGAFSVGIDSKPVIINSVITGNTAVSGGVSYIYDSHPVFVNTIIWDNTPEDFWFSDWQEYTNSITFAYCDVQEGTDDIINSEFATINWLEGNIDSDPLFSYPELNDYYLTENSPCIDTGTAFFEWEQEVLVDLDTDEYFGDAPDMGYFEFESINSEDDNIQSSIHDIQLSNYPNPFNPATIISFEIPREVAKNSELAIFNIKGQKIKTFSNLQITQSPNQQVIWNGEDESGNRVSSGIYYYQLQTGGFSRTEKMVLMR